MPPSRRAPFGILIVALVAVTALLLVFRAHGAKVAPSAAHPGTTPPSPTTAAPSRTPRSNRPTPQPTNVYAGIAPGDFAPAVRGIPERVYVPNGQAGTVEVINPKTFKILRRYPVGSYPEHVTPSWDLKTLYVDVSASSTLAVIDPRTGKLTGKRYHVPHPYNLYFTPDGSKAIAVVEYYNRIEFRDPHTFRLIKAVPMPCRGPDHMDFSADGTYFLISCEFDGNVIKVNDQTMKVVGRVNVGGLPIDVKLSPDGRVFYVSNQGRSGVSVVDPIRMRQIKFIHTGNGAHGFAVSRNTKFLYVSNRLAGTISVISFARQKVVHTWQVGGSPDMLQVSPDGTQLWLSNRYDSTVSVIDTRTGKVLHVIPVGPDPHGLAYFPQPGHYSLGHNGVYR